MRNERITSDGTIQTRRFAYLHRRNPDRFGLLEAVDHRDARRYLGSGYRIRQTWLTTEQRHRQMCDRDYRFEIVRSVFADVFELEALRKEYSRRCQCRPSSMSFPDWCHLCGGRFDADRLIEVLIPENAEHAPEPITDMLRVCRGCVAHMAGTFPTPNQTKEVNQ